MEEVFVKKVALAGLGACEFYERLLEIISEKHPGHFVPVSAFAHEEFSCYHVFSFLHSERLYAALDTLLLSLARQSLLDGDFVDFCYDKSPGRLPFFFLQRNVDNKTRSALVSKYIRCVKKGKKLSTFAKSVISFFNRTNPSVAVFLMDFFKPDAQQLPIKGYAVFEAGAQSSGDYTHVGFSHTRPSARLREFRFFACDELVGIVGCEGCRVASVDGGGAAFVLLADGGRMPTFVHRDLQSAIAEAYRLFGLLKKDIYIIKKEVKSI